VVTCLVTLWPQPVLLALSLEGSPPPSRDDSSPSPFCASSAPSAPLGYPFSVPSAQTLPSASKPAPVFSFPNLRTRTLQPSNLPTRPSRHSTPPATPIPSIVSAHFSSPRHRGCPPLFSSHSIFNFQPSTSSPPPPLPTFSQEYHSKALTPQGSAKNIIPKDLFPKRHESVRFPIHPSLACRIPTFQPSNLPTFEHSPQILLTFKLSPSLSALPPSLFP
jgi:hypothetical protein